MSLAKRDQAAFKAELRRLVAANRLNDANEQLLAAARGEDYATIRNSILHQAGQLRHYEDLRIQGTEDPAALVRGRNQLSLDLLSLIDQLPDAAAASAAAQKPKGVAELTLKRRMFWLLLIGKLTVSLFAAFLWATGTFTTEQFIGLVGILMPVFAAHLTLMVQDSTKNRSILEPGDARVNKDFARRAYLLCLAYPALLLFLLNLRGPGTVTHVQFTALLAMAETGLGTYLGKIVFGLFKAGEGGISKPANR